MKLKYMWFAFIAFFSATVGYMINGVLKANDPISEIFYNSNGTIKILFIIFILYVLIISVMSETCKNTTDKFEFKRNIPAGIFGLTTFGLLVVDSSLKLIDYILNHSGTYILMLSIAGGLASVAFLILSLSSILKKNFFEKASLLSLLTVLWACIRVITIIFIDYSNVNFNRLMILAIIGEILFLFTQAKIVSNVMGPKTNKRIVALGLISGVFIGVYSIPMLFVINNVGFSLSTLIDLSLLLYILIITWEMSSTFSSDNNDNNNQNLSIEDDYNYEPGTPKFFDKITAGKQVKDVKDNKNDNQEITLNDDKVLDNVEIEGKLNENDMSDENNMIKVNLFDEKVNNIYQEEKTIQFEIPKLEERKNLIYNKKSKSYQKIDIDYINNLVDDINNKKI